MKLRFWLPAAAVLLAVAGAWSQGGTGPRVTGIAPTSGKIGDSLTVNGENLGQDAVKAVFLSDAEKDYKGTVVEQTNEKIVLKVPDVKPGEYNISIQVGNNIFIQPVRFTVQS